MAMSGATARPADGAARAPAGWPAAASVLGIVAVAAAVHSLMGSRNFTGWDEWLYLDLASRGLVSFPHSNRPLALFWVLPAPWLAPAAFDGFHLLHAAYTAGTGLCAWVVARRLFPGAVVPLLAGVLAAVWSPGDSLRLATVLTSANLGATFAAAAALAFLVESWARQRPGLLVVSGALAFAAVRSYEPVAPLLVGGPLALVLVEPARRPARRGAWLVVYGGGLALALALAALPPPGAEPGQVYQSAARLDLAPVSVAGRLLRQLGSLASPALEPPWPLAPHGSAAAVLYVLFATLVARAETRAPPASARARPGTVLLTGVWLALCLVPFALSGVFVPGARAQILGAFGAGLFACSVIALGAGGRPRLRAGLAVAAGAWLVLVAAQQTERMQAEWTRTSLWPRQAALLGRLLDAAPDVRASTLFVLVDASGAFESTFAFRHAVHHLYGGRAKGWVAGAADGDLFYPTRFEADGVHAGVWPTHRRAWGETPRVYRYDELVVARVGSGGWVSLLGRWPGAPLPPLPQGATYAPGSRVLPGPRRGPSPPPR